MAKKASIWVVPHEDGWAVKREGAKKAIKVAAHKEQAVAAARRLAQKDKTELIVQDKDGSIQSKDSYGKDPSARRDREH